MKNYRFDNSFYPCQPQQKATLGRFNNTYHSKKKEINYEKNIALQFAGLGFHCGFYQ